MKILSVTSTLPRYDARWTRIINIVRLLNKNGIEVDLINYIVNGSKNHKELKKGHYNEVFFISDPVTLFLKHLHILRNDYDLVYGNTFMATFFCIFTGLLKKPLILDLHGISEEFPFLGKSIFYSFFMSIIEKITLLFSDKILCVSHKMIDYLHNEKGVPMNKLFYVPNGVDLNFFKKLNENQIIELRRKYNLGEKLIFGYLGDMHKWQGVENFISASNAILNDNFVAIIVGCDVSQWSQQGNVIYIPRVSKEDIVKYYSLCDVLVLPRPKHVVTEVAAPTKFAEYTAMSKPILTSNVGDAAELVKKYHNGLVMENNNIENLKDGIIRFLLMDDQKMRTMGQNSRKLAENEFDWNKIVLSLINILQFA